MSNEIDLDEVTPTKKEPRAKKTFKKVETPAPKIQQKESNEHKVQRLLSELFACSLDARREKILNKYKDAFKKFENEVGTIELENLIRNYLKEEIEGKLLAAAHQEE